MTATETKIETLEDVMNYLIRIPGIHNGGCGISALAIVRWAKKNWGSFSYSFLLGQNYKNVFETNVKALLEPNSKVDAASHVGVALINYETGKHYLIDAEGTYDMNSYAYTNVINNETLMVRSINAVDEWNPYFNRLWVNKIAKTLDIDLSDIDCRDPETFLSEVKETAKSFEKTLWEMIV